LTTNPSDKLFQNYERHYTHSGAGRWGGPIDEVKKFHLERLPRWLDCSPISAHVLDAGCANGYLLSLFDNAGFRFLTGVNVPEQLATRARKRLPKSISDVSSAHDPIATNFRDTLAISAQVGRPT
jgi:hypothetical protein